MSKPDPPPIPEHYIGIVPMATRICVQVICDCFTLPQQPQILISWPFTGQAGLPLLHTEGRLSSSNNLRRQGFTPSFYRRGT